MTDVNMFGASVGRGALRRWLLGADPHKPAGGGLTIWLPSYLREAERVEGYPTGKALLPRSFTVAESLTKWPETMLPALIVQLPGMSDRAPRRNGDGSYDAEWIVALSAVVRGKNEADTEALGDVYGLALRLLMLQQAGDFPAAGPGYTGPDLEVVGVDLADEGYDDLPQRRSRTLVAATVTFRVEVRSIASAAYGPTSPLASPATDPGSYPEVTEAELILERRPL